MRHLERPQEREPCGIALIAGDDPKVPGPINLTLRKRNAEVAQEVKRWAEREDLRRIIVSHADIIETDPRNTSGRLPRAGHG